MAAPANGILLLKVPELDLDVHTSVFNGVTMHWLEPGRVVSVRVGTRVLSPCRYFDDRNDEDDDGRLSAEMFVGIVYKVGSGTTRTQTASVYFECDSSTAEAIPSSKMLVLDDADEHIEENTENVMKKLKKESSPRDAGEVPDSNDDEFLDDE